MNKHKTPPSTRTLLRRANAAADAKFNADRFRKIAGDRTQWSVRDILRTWFFQRITTTK